MDPIQTLRSEIPDFDKSPFIVAWELTRSCALQCVHCRAESTNTRNPDELSTQEALSVLDEIKRFGSPLVIFTGGDPLRRPDINELVEYGSNLGLRIALTPSGTDEVTREKLENLKKRGIVRLAASLDGSTAEIHDGFRKVSGSYRWTLQIIRWANEIDIPLQINTTVTRYNFHDFDTLPRLLDSLKIVLWSIFFLVPAGRAKLDEMISPEDCEVLFEKMFQISQQVSFEIKSTEAMHYRRFLLQRKRVSSRSFLPLGVRPISSDGIRRSLRGVNDGNGFVFISHTGKIYPSGFLPICAGNVRKDSLGNVYRMSELFKTLRDFSQLKGKCGACEFKRICGGSRARAYAASGDFMASDPSCVYIPKCPSTNLAVSQ